MISVDILQELNYLFRFGVEVVDEVIVPKHIVPWFCILGQLIRAVRESCKSCLAVSGQEILLLCNGQLLSLCRVSSSGSSIGAPSLT